jgi:phosphohistidine phosphatase
MNVFILRHGLAVEPGSPGYTQDSERPLTPKGKQQLMKVAKGMRRLGLDFDLILASPYVRARQTADIVAKTLKLKKRLDYSEALTPSGSPKELIDYLNRLDPRPEDVLLVGHEPYLSQLISLLISGETGLAISMKKGGLCKLSADSLRADRCATLEWLLMPRMLMVKR